MYEVILVQFYLYLGAFYRNHLFIDWKWTCCILRKLNILPLAAQFTESFAYIYYNDWKVVKV